MKITRLAIPDVLCIEPQVFEDARGFFFESYNQQQLDDALGRPARFVLDGHSRSEKNVLRGLHYQIKQTQAKLVRVVAGKVFDVAVDLRKSSPTFGRWVGTTLSAENKQMMWIPEGFAHGFAVLTDSAELVYKMTDYWAPQHERCLRWNDPALGIDWNLTGAPLISDKDRMGLTLAEAVARAEVFV